MSNVLDLNATLAALPPEWPNNLHAEIQSAIQANPARRVCVLDDDPTGTQTVHDVTVYMDWRIETLVEALHSPAPTFYILTNSRSLPADAAQRLNHEIGTNLRAAAAQTGVEVIAISRSDSTLRGHFPSEVQALADGLEQVFDAWLLIPFFLEGGRYTLNDTHYVAEGAHLVPAHQTPFAQDTAFGYRTAYLPDWIAEKSAGRITADSVARITLSDLREGGPDVVLKKLTALQGGQMCVVNAASDRDLEVLVAALLRAEASGKRFLYRTAASFVAVRSGIFTRPVFNTESFVNNSAHGGLIVVGSYVPKTGRQLEALLASGIESALEVDVNALLDETQREALITRVSAAANESIQHGHDTVIYTSRVLIRAENAEANLDIGQRISNGLIDIVRRITERPRYILAKGGITSSDIATHGLGMQRAQVLGQLLPGVPVWRMGSESRFEDCPYIVFPGNVGSDDALVISRARLTKAAQDAR